MGAGILEKRHSEGQRGGETRLLYDDIGFLMEPSGDGLGLIPGENLLSVQ